MATYIVINKETLTIALHCPEFRIASEAADLVCPSHASRVSELNNAAFSCFTEYELMVLYKNITGEPITLRPYSELIKAVRFATEQIPLDQTPYDVWLKRAKEAFPDAPPEMLQPIPKASASPTPLPTILGGSGEPQGETPGEGKPQAAPRAPASGEKHQRPKPGGKTARVWDIADDVLKANHTGPVESITAAVWKEIRSRILTLAAEEGLNPGMATTQYGRWKSTITSQ